MNQKLKENPIEIKIYCRSCLDEISFETYQNNEGLCQDCAKDIKDRRTVCY